MTHERRQYEALHLAALMQRFEVLHGERFLRNLSDLLLPENKKKQEKR